MRDELFCKYQKNRHPKNFFYCTDPCVTITKTSGDHLPDEKVISFICKYLPENKIDIEIKRNDINV